VSLDHPEDGQAAKNVQKEQSARCGRSLFRGGFDGDQFELTSGKISRKKTDPNGDRPFLEWGWIIGRFSDRVPNAAIR
jgi:hypothetical protein